MGCWIGWFGNGDGFGVVVSNKFEECIVCVIFRRVEFDVDGCIRVGFDFGRNISDVEFVDGKFVSVGEGFKWFVGWFGWVLDFLYSEKWVVFVGDLDIFDGGVGILVGDYILESNWDWVDE